MLSKVIFVTASLLTILHLTNGAFKITECYACEYFDLHESDDENRAQSKKCEENPPPESFKVKCGEGDVNAGDIEWQCIKVEGRIEINDENFNYVKRNCSAGRNYDTCKDCKDTKAYETRYGFIKRGKHCVCEDDNLCNSANGPTLGVVSVITGLFVTLLANAF